MEPLATMRGAVPDRAMALIVAEARTATANNEGRRTPPSINIALFRGGTGG